MLPCRAHWPRPSISIMYGCGTVCDITLFARYCLVIPRQQPPKVGFGAPTADGFFFKRCAAGRRARLDGPSGRSLALGVCPWRASHAGIRGYGPRRPLEARVISARSRDLDLGSTASSHRSPCVALVRYDSGMTSPFSQLCFRSIVHDIAAAMSRRPVCYHTFAKSLRFTRHHTQLPFEMFRCQYQPSSEKNHFLKINSPCIAKINL